jgi:prepilin-type processing-associated H-X9-DG protein
MGTYVKIFFILILAVIFLWIAATTIPGFLVAASQPTPGIVGNINVQGIVYLQYNGVNVLWADGNYGSCYVSLVSTNCLQLTTNPPYNFGFILLSIVAIMFCCILLLIFAKKAGEV